MHILQNNVIFVIIVIFIQLGCINNVHFVDPRLYTEKTVCWNVWNAYWLPFIEQIYQVLSLDCVWEKGISNITGYIWMPLETAKHLILTDLTLPLFTFLLPSWHYFIVSPGICKKHGNVWPRTGGIVLEYTSKNYSGHVE